MVGKTEIKKREVKGYEKFVKIIQNNIEYSSICEEGYLEKDMNKAASRFMQDRHFLKVLDILKLSGDERILDFGAGRGLASYAFVNKGFNTITLEMSDSRISGVRAMKKYKRNIRRKLKIVNGDAENMPFKKNLFDVAYCNHVLHHSADLQKMMEQVVSVIKPGGILIAQSEVMRPPFISDSGWKKKFLAAKLGANETLYSTFQYVRAFKRAGLKYVKAISLLDIEDIMKSKTLKGKIAYFFLRNKLIWNLFQRIYTYFGLPGNPIMIYGYKSR